MNMPNEKWPTKLNVGGGHKVIPGYLNIDLADTADFKSDVRKIDLPDGYADEIIAIHIVEHLERWDVPVALKEWHRLLKRKCMIAIELPDLLKVCRNLVNKVADDGFSRRALYGDPSSANPLMMHRWGWTVEELSDELKNAGFVRITEASPQYHGRRVYRDMRLEAYKP